MMVQHSEAEVAVVSDSDLCEILGVRLCNNSLRPVLPQIYISIGLYVAS